MSDRHDRETNNKTDDQDELDEDVVVLTDEEGQEETFRILMDDLFVQDRQYVVLMPIGKEDDFEPEIVILRVEALEEGETTLVTIDNDDEWEDVLRAFEDMDIEGSLSEYEIEFEDDEEDTNEGN